MPVGITQHYGAMRLFQSKHGTLGSWCRSHWTRLVDVDATLLQLSLSKRSIMIVQSLETSPRKLMATRLNPHVRSALSHFHLAIENGSLFSRQGRVSSFGFSGTIAHAVLAFTSWREHAPVMKQILSQYRSKSITVTDSLLDATKCVPRARLRTLLKWFGDQISNPVPIHQRQMSAWLVWSVNPSNVINFKFK